MRVLIVGAGIAGSTLAYWLQRAGHEPTLLERAPTLRRGGYLIDFWGTGFDVAGCRPRDELVAVMHAEIGFQAILDQLPRARTLYLDRANQIRMPSWTNRRVALIGDAVASPSLLADQGSALAMVAAYVLAAELVSGTCRTGV